MATIGSITPDVCNSNGFVPARKSVERFASPMLTGFGTQSGPARQSQATATTYHKLANLAAVKSLFTAANALVDTFVSVDPAGSGSSAFAATNVKVEAVECDYRAVAGLPATAGTPNTHLAVLQWRFLLPIDW